MPWQRFARYGAPGGDHRVSGDACAQRPAGIAASPDGHLWFTDTGNDEIGKINPATGQITEYAGTPAFNGPEGIAPGPDGRLWFTDTGNAEIGAVGTGVPAASILAPVIAGSEQVAGPQVCEGDRWSDWAGQQPVTGELPQIDGYRWLSGGAPIAGATGQTYAPSSPDASLSCEATVTYPLLRVTVSATSQAVPVTAPPAMPAGVLGPVGPSVPLAQPALPAHPAGPVPPARRGRSSSSRSTWSRASRPRAPSPRRSP